MPRVLGRTTERALHLICVIAALMQVTGEVVRPENRVHAKRSKVVKCSALFIVINCCV